MTGDLVTASAAADRDVYARLIADLDASGARYRLIEHAPEGAQMNERTGTVADRLARLGLQLPPPPEAEAIAQVSDGAADKEGQPL